MQHRETGAREVFHAAQRTYRSLCIPPALFSGKHSCTCAHVHVTDAHGFIVLECTRVYVCIYMCVCVSTGGEASAAREEEYAQLPSPTSCADAEKVKCAKSPQSCSSCGDIADCCCTLSIYVCIYVDCCWKCRYSHRGERCLAAATEGENAIHIQMNLSRVCTHGCSCSCSRYIRVCPSVALSSLACVRSLSLSLSLSLALNNPRGSSSPRRRQSPAYQ